MAYLRIRGRKRGYAELSKKIRFLERVEFIQGAGLLPKGSIEYYVDGTDGNDSKDGRSMDNAFKTIGKALESVGANDVLYIVHGDYDITAKIDWSFSDARFIGNSNIPNQPHLDIWQSGTFNPMIEMGGRGNVFANLTFRHGTAGTDLTALLVSGRYNYFENVYFLTPLVAAQDIATYMGVDITGHNNYFRGCHFGNEGLARDQANYNLRIKGSGNIFEDCFFSMMADGVAPFFLNLETSDDRRYTLFKNCIFYVHWANNADQITYAVKASGAGATSNVFFDSRCVFIGVDYIVSGADDGHVWMASPGEAAATALTGLGVKDLGT